jgi:transposase-like protein
MITEKTLRKWRSDALKYPRSPDAVQTANGIEMAERILRLTQELLDQHLLRKG